jgi:ribonuclease R
LGQDHKQKPFNKRISALPSRDDILSFIQQNGKDVPRRDIAKAFRLKGVEPRRYLKELLKVLVKEGLYTRVRKKQRLDQADQRKEAKPKDDLPKTILGIIYHTDLGLRFIPLQRKIDIAFQLENAIEVTPDKIGTVFQGTIVSMDPPLIHLDHVMGETGDVSLLVSHMANLPMEFSKEAIKIAEQGSIPPLGNREDLRKIPLITIDGKDARDFDDAVWAEPDTDPSNKGGWHLIVAIADVAHYVRPGTILDQEAYLRSTSVYFPDRVIPMLPEVLSNGLCSLNPNEDRACVAVHIWIDKNGQKKRHRFCRGLMRSSARMTYEEVQSLYETPGHPRHDFLKPLYGAFESLKKARFARGTLELDVPEPYLIFDDEGHVKDLVIRDRLDSHRLIEEFMILANVAAAEELEHKKMPCMYRVHAEPSSEKLEEVRALLRRVKLRYEGSLKTPQDLMRLLTFVEGSPYQTIVHELVLRSQSQALYQPTNIGHFGLNLTHYAHFTSPIRRYADVLVHRALLSTLGYKEDGLPAVSFKHFDDYGKHISTAERRAQGAEREAMDRYKTHFLSNRVGETFDVYVTGITKAGLFVTIPDFNASGLVPLRLMQDDYYMYRENPTRLEGRRTRKKFGFGDPLKVRLLEADLTKGRLTFDPFYERARERVSTKLSKKRQKKRHRR